MINYEDDDLTVTREQLAPLARLVQHLREQQQVVETLEEQLKGAKRELRKLEEEHIPELMAEIGLEMVTMENGQQLSVKEILYASISSKNKPEAIRWLVDHGQGSLVREDVTVPFDKGQMELAEALVAHLRSSGYTPEVQENVNTTSVKSVIKELLEQGVDVPLDLFGAHFVKKAVLKP